MCPEPDLRPDQYYLIFVSTIGEASFGDFYITDLQAKKFCSQQLTQNKELTNDNNYHLNKSSNNSSKT